MRVQSLRLSGGSFLIALLLVCGLAAPAAAQTKPYTVNVSPSQSLVGGVQVTFRAVFTNLARPQQLGSANLTVPAAYTIVSASVTPPGSATLATGNVVQLRNLALQPSQSLTVTVVANVPAVASCGEAQTSTWAVEAKQANDFSGLPGNDFDLMAGASSLTTTVTAANCGATSIVCDAGADCNTMLSLTNIVTFAVTALHGAGTDAGLLTINSGPKDDCAGYDELTGAGFAVDFIPGPGGTGRQKDVTATISKDIMNAQSDNGAAHLQMCFGAPFQFPVRPGTPPLQQPTPGFFIGLLPDCGDPPCVSSRGKTGAGQGVIEVLAPGGDNDPRYSP